MTTSQATTSSQQCARWCPLVGIVWILLLNPSVALSQEAFDFHKCLLDNNSYTHCLVDEAIEEETLRGKLAGDEGKILIAEGDSWFNYPSLRRMADLRARDDILVELEETYNYVVFSVAHYGETLEQMAYDKNQISGLVSKMLDVRNLYRNNRPEAVLISAGGNDVASPEIATLINHRLYQGPLADGVNNAMSTAFIERLSGIMIEYLKAVRHATDMVFPLEAEEGGQDHNSPPVPILVHGYDFIVPDGRGYGYPLNFKGPWIKPSFDHKNYEDISFMKQEIRDFMEEYNRAICMKITEQFSDSNPSVFYINLLGVVGADKWANETHPNREGFSLIAVEVDKAVQVIAGESQATQTNDRINRCP